MNEAFPMTLLSLIRCARDGGGLEAVAGAANGEEIVNGSVRCLRCASTYRIVGGILDLLQEPPADPRSAFEMGARDRDATRSDHPGGVAPWQPGWRDELEVPETLDSVGDVSGRTILELGSGTGVYTRPLASQAERLIAVDFSIESLRINARHLDGSALVGLIRADVARLRLRPGSFDLALTSLYSNLPTAALRAAANRAVHEALVVGGRYVVSAHHQDLRRRLRRLESAGIYEDCFPVFFQCFTARSLRRELHEFHPVSVRPIVVFLPYLSRLRFTRRALSRAAGRIPVLGMFGRLLLAAATKPDSPRPAAD